MEEQAKDAIEGEVKALQLREVKKNAMVDSINSQLQSAPELKEEL